MNRKAPALWLLLALTGTACGEAPGKVSLTVSWGDQPSGTLWLVATVQRVDERTDTRQQVASASRPVRYHPGLAIVLSDVPNGPGLEVTLDARADSSVDSRVLYHGRSAPFALRLGEQRAERIVVEMAAAPSLTNLLVAEATGPPDCPTCHSSQAVVRLSFLATDAVAVQIANDNSFTQCATLLAPGSDAPGIMALEVDGETWTVFWWDLDCGLANVGSGPRSVYVRLFDTDGYASETLAWVGELDRQPPTDGTLICADGGRLFAETASELEATMLFGVLRADEMWVEAYRPEPDDPEGGPGLPGALLPCSTAPDDRIAVSEWTGLATRGCVRLRDETVTNLRVKYRDFAHNETRWVSYAFERVVVRALPWVPIPEGSFSMGCAPESAGCFEWAQPPHAVAVAPFDLFGTEVTEELYEAVVGTNPSCGESWGPEAPVECVDWLEARTFCAIIGGRLPTEAEWEYAARAGTSTAFFCGDDPACVDEIAWHGRNGRYGVGMKEPVGGKTPNDFGLFDMLGNVEEWVEDCEYDYAVAPADAFPAVDADCGSFRLVRGGSYTAGDAEMLTVWWRDRAHRSAAEMSRGFRCARCRHL